MAARVQLARVGVFTVLQLTVTNSVALGQEGRGAAAAPQPFSGYNDFKPLQRRAGAPRDDAVFGSLACADFLFDPTAGCGCDTVLHTARVYIEECRGAGGGAATNTFGTLSPARGDTGGNKKNTEITTAYDPASCVLSLTGAAALGEYVAAIANVVYTPPAQVGVGVTRTVWYQLGGGAFSPWTQRFYSTPADAAAASPMGDGRWTWREAQAYCAAAANDDPFGGAGYLATITTPREAGWVRSAVLAPASGSARRVWLGAVAVHQGVGAPPTWRWVAGPSSGCPFDPAAAGYTRTACDLDAPLPSDAGPDALLSAAAPLWRAGEPRVGSGRALALEVDASVGGSADDASYGWVAAPATGTTGGDAIAPLCEYGGVGRACLPTAQVVGRVLYAAPGFDECAVDGRCPLPGRTCVDPDRQSLGNWACVCRAPTCYSSVLTDSEREVMAVLNGAAAIGSIVQAGTLAPAVGKLAIIRQLHCQAVPRVGVGEDATDLDDAFAVLSFDLHPFGVAVGNEPMRHHIGLMLAAPISIIAVLLCACIIAAILAVGNGDGLPAALAGARVPSIAYVPYVVVLPGAAFAGAELLFRSATVGGWAVLGGAVLLSCAAVPGVLHAVLFSRVKDAAEYLDDPRLRIPNVLVAADDSRAADTPHDPRPSFGTVASRDDIVGDTFHDLVMSAADASTPLTPGGAHKGGGGIPSSPQVTTPPPQRRPSPSADRATVVPYVGCRRSLYCLVYGAYIWVAESDASAVFCERNGILFQRLAGGKMWAPLVELTSTTVVAMLAAWPADTPAECDVRNYAMAVVSFVWLGVLLGSGGVYTSPLDNIAATAIAALTFGGATCYAAAAASGAEDNSSFSRVNAALMLTGASGVAVAKCLCDAVSMAVDVCSIHRGVWLAERRARRRRQNSTPGATSPPPATRVVSRQLDDREPLVCGGSSPPDPLDAGPTGDDVRRLEDTSLNRPADASFEFRGNPLRFDLGSGSGRSGSGPGANATTTPAYGGRAGGGSGISPWAPLSLNHAASNSAAALGPVARERSFAPSVAGDLSLSVANGSVAALRPVDSVHGGCSPYASESSPLSALFRGGDAAGGTATPLHRTTLSGATGSRPASVMRVNLAGSTHLGTSPEEPAKHTPLVIRRLGSTGASAAPGAVGYGLNSPLLGDDTPTAAVPPPVLELTVSTNTPDGNRRAATSLIDVAPPRTPAAGHPLLPSIGEALSPPAPTSKDRGRTSSTAPHRRHLVSRAASQSPSPVQMNHL